MTAGDRGAATVWTVGGIAAVLAATVLLVTFGSAVTTRHRAASAADLAALAAASTAASGAGPACGRARWVVERMGAHLAECRLDGWDAVVEVTAEPPIVLGDIGPAHARARAGPAAAPFSPRRTVVHER